MSGLGFGVGYRPVHFQDFAADSGKSCVDWIEIISENFMGIGGIPRERLEWLQERYPIVMHGVSLSIAGTDPLDMSYLATLRDLADRINPPLISDHLCWTNTHGRQLHDLLPFPYTQNNLLHIADRVDHVQQYLGRRLLLENPTAYVAFKADEMPEAEFLAALAEKSGCGILLDINNLYVNQRNLGYDPQLYFELLSPTIVAQFHLAGHSVSGNIRIDTHDQPVCAEVWNLFRLAAARYPDASPMIEWDDQIPTYARLMQEVTTAREIHQQVTKAQRVTPADAATHQADSLAKRSLPALALHDLQMSFAAHIAAGENGSETKLLSLTRATPATAKAGLAVYQQAYFLRICDALKEAFPTLYYIIEEPGFRKIVADYLTHTALTEPSLDRAGKALPHFLNTVGISFEAGAPAAVFADLAALDLAMVDAFLALDVPFATPKTFATLPPDQWETLRLEFVPSARLLRLASDPTAVWQAAKEGSAAPPPPLLQPTNLLVYRHEGHPLFYSLDDFAADIMQAFQAGHTLSAICENQLRDEAQLAEVLTLISGWVGRGLVCA